MVAAVSAYLGSKRLEQDMAGSRSTASAVAVGCSGLAFVAAEEVALAAYSTWTHRLLSRRVSQRIVVGLERRWHGVGRWSALLLWLVSRRE